jgi:hypothetical protein
MKREHKTFFGRTFGVVWDGIKSIFEKAYEEADHVLLEAAILITNTAKDALKSGIVNIVVKATPTQLDDKLLEAVNKQLPKILAGELFLKGINDNSTEEEIQSVLKQVLDEFGGLPDEKKEKFYTSVAAEIYIFFEQTENGKKITFGKAAQLAESAFQEWLELKSK